MHVIRLHGPWTLEIGDGASAVSRRVHLPRDWATVADAARHSAVSLVRRFHRPTGLSEATRVALAVPAGWPLAGISVNGARLSEPDTVDGRQVVDLSRIIQSEPAHEVRINFVPGDMLHEQPYYVAIEIDD